MLLSIINTALITVMITTETKMEVITHAQSGDLLDSIRSFNHKNEKNFKTYHDAVKIEQRLSKMHSLSLLILECIEHITAFITGIILLIFEYSSSHKYSVEHPLSVRVEEI